MDNLSIEDIAKIKKKFIDDINVRLEAVKAIDALSQYALSLEKELSRFKEKSTDIDKSPRKPNNNK